MRKINQSFPIYHVMNLSFYTPTVARRWSFLLAIRVIKAKKGNGGLIISTQMKFQYQRKLLLHHRVILFLFTCYCESVIVTMLLYFFLTYVRK